jgi:Cysteine-rich secretory protein family
LFSLALTAVLAGQEPRAFAQYRDGTVVHTAAEQLMALANRERAQSGAGKLEWDPALAAAALQHCQRMVQEGPIAHQYTGEPDLAERAGQAGAHFSVIEENVAIGPSAAAIHEEWMHSPGHRSNLLSPDVDRVGIAVIASRGVLYAVADYSHGVKSMGTHEAEVRVAALLRQKGVSIITDSSLAREVCAMDSGMPRAATARPGFIMRWQDSQLDQLPSALVDRLSSGRYHRAAVGSCPAQGVQGTFTAYRMAVLLY